MDRCEGVAVRPGPVGEDALKQREERPPTEPLLDPPHDLLGARRGVAQPVGAIVVRPVAAFDGLVGQLADQLTPQRVQPG